MKKLFFLLALTLAIGPPSQSQSTVTFPASGKLTTQDWVRAYVDSVLGHTPQHPEVPSVLKPCDEGPVLQTITNITGSSLVASFHGKNVYGLDFHIVNASGVVRMGSIKPTSSSLLILFQTLPPGTYKLRLFGNTCQGKSEKEFVIPAAPINGERKQSFIQAPKLLFDISTDGGLYSDVTEGDYQDHGQRYRDANGRKYRAFYFLNDIPWKNPDDTPQILLTYPCGMA